MCFGHFTKQTCCLTDARDKMIGGFLNHVRRNGSRLREYGKV